MPRFWVKHYLKKYNNNNNNNNNNTYLEAIKQGCLIMYYVLFCHIQLKQIHMHDYAFYFHEFIRRTKYPDGVLSLIWCRGNRHFRRQNHECFDLCYFCCCFYCRCCFWGTMLQLWWQGYFLTYTGVLSRKSLMTKWLEQASQWHEMYCHDLEVVSSDPIWIELGVRSTSIQSRAWSKNIYIYDKINQYCNTYILTHLLTCMQLLMFHHTITHIYYFKCT